MIDLLLNHFFIILPQAVHLVFSKNWSSPQRLFSHLIIIPAPQISHRSLVNVCLPQVGQGI